MKWTFKIWLLKLTFVIGLLVLGIQALNAQNSTAVVATTTKINRLFQFDIECPLIKCDILGRIVDSTVYVAPAGAQFVLVDIKKDSCIIRFSLAIGSSKKHKNAFAGDDFTSYTYFYISKAQLDYKAKPITRSSLDLVVGSIFTPVKLRFQPFDFAKDIAIGSSIGIKYSLNQNKDIFLDGIIGLSVSALTLDSLATKNTQDTPVDLLAFTPSLGLVLEFGNAQVGCFTGLDLLSNSNQEKYRWIYYNRPWFSFGIGFSIFSVSIKK